MLGSVLTLLFFLIIGISWRLLKPRGISAESLQRGLTELIHLLFLPLTVFFIMLEMPLNASAMKVLFYVLGVTAIALAVAWVWLWKIQLAGKTKGALLIASAFGSVFYLGVPLNEMFYPDWTVRVAVEYGLVANLLLLYTAGVVLSRSLGESVKGGFGKALAALKNYKVWLKEPMVWAALLALVLNAAGIKPPTWLAGIKSAVFGAMVPLLLLSTALSLNWSKAWNNQIVGALPAVAIQLILVPLLMWGMVSLFGSAGASTTRTLLLDSMLPATLFGFLFCERYKLDTAAYTLAFTVMTALSFITIPVWAKVML